jgi:Sec-independent protein translocase protein TatA
VGFGTELLLAALLGYLLLGPKRMYSMLRQVARAKSEFEKARHNITSQLSAELNSAPQERKQSKGKLRAAVPSSGE